MLGSLLYLLPSPHTYHSQKEILKLTSSHTSLLLKTVQGLPTAFGVKYLSMACKAHLHLTLAFSQQLQLTFKSYSL